MQGMWRPTVAANCSHLFGSGEKSLPDRLCKVHLPLQPGLRRSQRSRLKRAAFPCMLGAWRLRASLPDADDKLKALQGVSPYTRDKSTHVSLAAGIAECTI